MSLDRYNPANLKALEEQVGVQCQSGSYDLNANLSALKLYQFFPAHTNVEIISKILLKALTRFPDSDFTLCLSLLNEQNLNEEPIKKVLALSDALETANFVQIWTLLKESGDLIAPVTGFVDSIRKCISTTIAITHQTILVTHLQKYFNADDTLIKQLVQSLGWTMEGEIVKIPLNTENQARPHLYQENIKFEQLTKIIAHSNN